MRRIVIGWLFAGLLFSDLSDHLKPLSSSSGSYKIENIDCIYMINLDERPEKFVCCLEALAPYGITPYRVSAINGWNLSLEAINDVGVQYQLWMTEGMQGTCFLPEYGGTPRYEAMATVGRTYFYNPFFLGSIGVVLSHASVLQDAMDAGYETIWVMEDDVEIISDPNLLSGLVNRLDQAVGKNGWDVLFTDRDTKNKQGDYVICTSYAKRPNFTPPNPNHFAKVELIGTEFRRIGARYGTYSMILRRSGIKKILEFLKAYQVFLPYDMEMTLPAGIRLVTVLDDIVSTQPSAESDNGAPNYRFKS